eukprot:263255-Amphidinium_carterae.1
MVFSAQNSIEKRLDALAEEDHSHCDELVQAVAAFLAITQTGASGLKMSCLWSVNARKMRNSLITDYVSTATSISSQDFIGVCKVTSCQSADAIVEKASLEQLETGKEIILGGARLGLWTSEATLLDIMRPKIDAVATEASVPNSKIYSQCWCLVLKVSRLRNFRASCRGLLCGTVSKVEPEVWYRELTALFDKKALDPESGWRQTNGFTVFHLLLPESEVTEVLSVLADISWVDYATQVGTIVEHSSLGHALFSFTLPTVVGAKLDEKLKAVLTEMNKKTKITEEYFVQCRNKAKEDVKSVLHRDVLPIPSTPSSSAFESAKMPTHPREHLCPQLSASCALAKVS